MKRNCGWLGCGEPGRLVWARGGLALGTCPKSYITAESEALLEHFLARRRIGGARAEELSAREVEAFVVLEEALAQERKHGQHTRRPDRHL